MASRSTFGRKAGSVLSPPGTRLPHQAGQEIPPGAVSCQCLLGPQSKRVVVVAPPASASARDPVAADLAADR